MARRDALGGGWVRPSVRGHPAIGGGRGYPRVPNVSAAMALAVAAGFVASALERKRGAKTVRVPRPRGDEPMESRAWRCVIG